MTWATDRLDELVRGDASAPPVVNTLKLGLLDDWKPGWVRKVWRSAPDILQSDGTMFGGYLAALADQVAAFAAMTVLPGDMIFRTSGLQIQFFKVLRNPDLDIVGRVVSASQSVIAVEVEFRAGETLAAKAFASQFLIPIRTPAS